MDQKGSCTGQVQLTASILASRIRFCQQAIKRNVHNVNMIKGTQLRRLTACHGLYNQCNCLSRHSSVDVIPITSPEDGNRFAFRNILWTFFFLNRRLQILDAKYY
jgi:hypothetical protein